MSLFVLRKCGPGKPFLFHGRWVRLIGPIRVSTGGCWNSKGRLNVLRVQSEADGNSMAQFVFGTGVKRMVIFSPTIGIQGM